jgi:hypothetical protein
MAKKIKAAGTERRENTITEMIRYARLRRRAFILDSESQILSDVTTLYEKTLPIRRSKLRHDNQFASIYRPDRAEKDPVTQLIEYQLETESLVAFKLDSPDDIDWDRALKNAELRGQGIRATPNQLQGYRDRTRRDAEGLAQDGLMPSKRRRYEKSTSFEKNRYNFPVSLETRDHIASMDAERRDVFFRNFEAGMSSNDAARVTAVSFRKRWRRDHLVEACSYIEDIADWIDEQMKRRPAERDSELAAIESRYWAEQISPTKSKKISRRQSVLYAIAITTGEQISNGRGDFVAKPEIARAAVKAYGRYELAKGSALKRTGLARAKTRKSRNILISSQFSQV